MMKRVALFTLLSAATAWAAPVTYALDPEKCELLAFTSPTGLFEGASHSHVVRAQKVSGKIIYDADAVSSSWVTVSFPVEAMVIDEPALRTREGMTTMPTERDREDVARTIRSPKQLDVGRFPSISFDSTRVVKLDDGKLEVTGRLGIHGVRKTITLPIDFKFTADGFRGEGTYTFTHKDFGIATYSALMGTVRNAEPIRLKILLVGIPRTATDVLIDPLLTGTALPDAGTTTAAPEKAK
jgi:polyisoprenoid-binding protein YceI